MAHTTLPHILFCLVFLGLFAGCSTGEVNQRRQLRSLFLTDSNQALEFLEKSSLAKEKKLRLLYFMERGLLLRAGGAYSAAALSMQNALELSEQWYKKSVSQRAATFALNENYENYYAAPIEHSMLYFYMASSFFELYQSGVNRSYDLKTHQLGTTVQLSPSERQQALQQARAAVVAWNSFFEKMQKEGTTIYRADLLMHLFGAKVHQTIGDSTDREIAKGLLDKASLVLKKIGYSLPSFNQAGAKFAQALSKNDGVISQSMRQNLIRPTSFSKDLTKYLKNEKKRISRKKSSYHLVSLVVEEGLVAPKRAKNIDIGLRGAIDNVKDPKLKVAIAAIGPALLLNFAYQTLGLKPQNAGQALLLTQGIVAASMSEAAIRFEVPTIGPAPTKKLQYQLSTSQKDVSQGELNLINPISDIAQLNVEEKALKTVMKASGRVLVKHLLAIVSAYQTYQLVNKNSQSAFFAKTAGVAAYLAGSRLIKESEKADLRQWATLPNAVYMTTLSLKPGIYKIQLGDSSYKHLVEVKPSEKNQLFFLRTQVGNKNSSH